jgi:hypothetical protein
VAWFFVTGGWVLGNPRNNAGVRGVMVRLTLMLVNYTLFWTLVAVAIWALAPTVLVESRAGLQTAVQVLPATVVAILVLTLGSLFVIAQTTTATWGTRAPIMLISDNEVARMTGRPLVLASASLLLSGQVPDSGEPAHLVLAAVAALMLATVRLFASVATLAAALVQRYTLPRAFPQYLVEDIDRELEGGELDFLVSRAPMLGEMARMSLRRGDSIALDHTLEATRLYQVKIAEASEETPALRRYRTVEGAVRDGWLAEDLTTAMVRVGEEALTGSAPASDLQRIAVTLGTLASNFVRTGDQGGARRSLDGLIELGTSAHQVGQVGAINYYDEPAFQLAFVEGVAEASDLPDVAAHALAGWALCSAYPVFHFQAPAHPLMAASITALGPDPPWQGARSLVESQAWQRAWANKQYHGPDPVIELLDGARPAWEAREGEA